MFQVITLCNLLELDDYRPNSIELRGYSTKTFLTGQFASQILRKEIKPLSTSDIADFLCPTRRDLYIKKGRNKPRGVRTRKTWGSRAGIIVEGFMKNLFNQNIEELASYSNVKEKANQISESFKVNNQTGIGELNALKSIPDEDPTWFFKQLTNNGRGEIGFNQLHKKLLGNGGIDINNLVNSCAISPLSEQIGITSPVSPDFLIDKYNIVGDIKSGYGGFKEYYLMTCTGYALAFENEKGRNNNIDFGIIYFFPTRHLGCNHLISFGQVYVFPITDELRSTFIAKRNSAYGIVSNEDLPNFPSDKNNCSSCQYLDYCKSQGLQV